MVNVAVQFLKLLLLYGGLRLRRLVEQGVDLVRLLAQLRGCRRCRRDVAALIEGDDVLRVGGIVVHRLAQRLAALLRLGVDRMLCKDADQIVRLLERVLRVRGTVRVAGDDEAAQLTQPLMKVVLRLEQRDAVLDRDGEQMLIVRARRLELIEHNGEQHDHQRDHAADESRQLQTDGHSLSHSNPPHSFSRHHTYDNSAV